MLKNAPYAGIRLDAPPIALYPKLYWHNVSNPSTLQPTAIFKELANR